MRQNAIGFVLNASHTCPQPPFIADAHFLRVPVNDSFCEKILPWLDRSLDFIGVWLLVLLLLLLLLLLPLLFFLLFLLPYSAPRPPPLSAASLPTAHSPLLFSPLLFILLLHLLLLLFWCPAVVNSSLCSLQKRPKPLTVES